MATYSDTLRDGFGKPIAGAYVTVSDQSGALVTLTNLDDSALSNPFVTDQFGDVVFQVSSVGNYTIDYNYGGRLVQRDRNIFGVGGGGGGGSVYPTLPKYGVYTGTSGAYAGLVIDDNGQITDPFERHLWLNQFYASDTSTDTDALLRFASLFNSAAIGDCVLHFTAGHGRGPSARYLIDQEILFTGPNRLVIDFEQSTVRLTTPASKFRYAPPQIGGGSGTTPVTHFVVKNAIVQYAAAVDCAFYWDLKYIPSRFEGTGYAENIRIIPQDTNNVGHTITSGFRTKNTWYWSAIRCAIRNHGGSIATNVAGSTAIRQEQLCVVTSIDNCDINNFDTAIVPGLSAMVGIEGTFSNGGSFSRGKMIVQGANSAYMGRNDGAYGSTYSLYDETGTLTTGIADIYDFTGAPAGNITITSINRYSQPSEAISVHGGTTVVGCNYMINATAPSGVKWLEWTFVDMHCAPLVGQIKVDGIASLAVGPGVFFIANGDAMTMFDVNNADMVNFQGVQASTNDRPNCLFLKGRNITGGSMTANTLYFFKYAGDFDNTVKSFKVVGNSAYELTTGNNPSVATFLSTAKRYNATNTRGVLFASNGLMGKGFDQDDPRKVAWAPTITSDGGAPTNTLVFSGINVSNGMLHYSCKFNVTNLNGASGRMYVSFPSLTSWNVPDSALQDHAAAVRISNIGLAGAFDATNKRIEVATIDTRNTTQSAFQTNNVDIGVPYGVFISGSVPIEFD